MRTMTTVVLGPAPPELEELIARRKRLGLDKHDEVWEGVYHMAPDARFNHGELTVQLACLLRPIARSKDLFVTSPFNIGRHKDDFRVPDLGVHREHLGDTVWVPTAAIVVEVLSPHDESMQKFDFYSSRGVEEVWIVDGHSRRVRIFTDPGTNGYDETGLSRVLERSAAEIEAQIDWR